jgi:lipoprotein-releasing system permease protein
VNGIDAALESDSSVLSQFFLEGGLVELSGNRWGIVIGKTLSDFLGVKVGDSINLYSTSININPLIPMANYREFEIVGVFRVGNQELDANLVIANIEASKALFRLRSAFNGLRIRTVDVLEANKNLPRLSEMLPQTVEVSSWRDQFGAVYENIRFSRTIIGFMLWLLIGVAAFNLVVSLTMIVRDKKGDIAILRTLGASPELIHRIFLWQGGLIGVLGISIGVFLGIIGSLQITRFAEFIEGFLSIKILNAEVYPIDFLPSQLHVADVLIVIFGVMLLSLLATIYPARRASAIRPAEALRSE